MNSGVLDPLRQHRAKLKELRHRVTDPSAIDLMHHAPERTLGAYGRKILPALAGA
ncbi:MAG: hypothetical protein J4G09_02670 [Proteobacteria bacterium]|nr:hypothetical protein [Pseudomonadota bacterium]